MLLHCTERENTAQIKHNTPPQGLVGIHLLLMLGWRWKSEGRVRMKEGRGGSVGTLRVLSCVQCCFINIVHFQSYSPQNPQLYVFSASVTHRPHPSTLVLPVSANRYTHNRTCAHKYCTHRAHQFTMLLLFQSNLSRLLCEVSPLWGGGGWLHLHSTCALQWLHGDPPQTPPSIKPTLDCHLTQRKENTHTPKTTGNATVLSKWMTRLHRVNFITKLQRWNNREVEELKCTGVPC